MQDASLPTYFIPLGSECFPDHFTLKYL